MRLAPALLSLLLLLALTTVSHAQSGGGGGGGRRDRPRAVTMIPPWSDSLTDANAGVGSDPGIVITLFVGNREMTSRIVWKVKPKDAQKKELSLLKNFGYARLVLTRKELKKREGNGALAAQYGVRSIPGGVVTDTYGNVLFPLNPAKLGTTKAAFKVANKADKALKKLIDRIEKGYASAERLRKAGKTDAARGAYKKIAGYKGHPLALKAREQLKKLSAATDGS